MINFIKEFINPIFYKFLYMSLIGIIVGLFILLIRKIFDKKVSPTWKCIIWLLLIVSLVVPFRFNFNLNKETNIVSISGLMQPIQEISNNYIIEEKVPNYNLDNKTEEVNIQQNESPNIKENINYSSLILNIIIPSIWIIGIILYLLVLCIGNLIIKKNIRKSFILNDSINSILLECKQKLNIKKDIPIILQNFKKTPSIYGIFKPKILITKDFINQDYKTKKYVLMHELSHYKRNDLFFNQILLIIIILHWFNPFIWLYFKKIRQDIELATDEIVLNRLEDNEKKEYGMVLINSLQIFKEERYMTKLLCITDNGKNMERRIRMVKFSEKFKENKLLICFISICIIFLGIFLFFTQNNKTEEINNEPNSNVLEQQYEYKAFKPTFKKSSDSTYEYYDFTQDMVYNNNGTYYKKINTFEEYREFKSRWSDILDMSEDDFKNNFMLITAVENTSMLGLTVDMVEADNNNLYVSLIHYDEGIEFNKDETCISYRISRDLERENIYVTRNLRNNEKDMSTEVKISEKSPISSSDLAFSYRDEQYRKLENNSSENFKVIPVDWKDFAVKRFTITTDMPEIDFSNWTYLGDDFYSLAVTKHSEYLKLMNNYQTPKLTHLEFKYIYPIIIVRKSSDNSISVDDSIKEENGKSYLNIDIGGFLDVVEGFKYPAVCIFVPNYRSLESSFLNVRVAPSNPRASYVNITDRYLTSSYYNCGLITKLENNSIYFETKDHGQFIIDNNSNIEFINGRTLEKVNYSDIKNNYYIQLANNSKVFIYSNITGTELKNELLENLSKQSDKNRNAMPNIGIKDINKLSEKEAIVTIYVYDFVNEDFGKENNDKIELQVKFNQNTKFTSKGNNIKTIDDLEIAKYNINTLYVDKSTINSEYPIVTSFESIDN